MPEPPLDQSLLHLWRAGDQKAAQAIFDRYANQLMDLARRRISQRLARRIDPEDIVQSVFRTFFDRARAGKFHVEGPDDLCKLLVRITVRKTLRQVAFHRAAKRDMNQEAAPGDSQEDRLLEVLDREPTPETAGKFLDQLDHLINQMRPDDREIIELRLQGYNNVEIAAKLGISDRKIRRLLERLRGLASQGDINPPGSPPRPPEDAPAPPANSAPPSEGPPSS
jgi:RNA polymerase sigma-70 factor (ECF subfamily)